MLSLDQATINFDQSSLLLMNVLLAVVMFGVALDIEVKHFKQLFKQPKLLFIGVASQFFLLPLLTFLVVLALKPPASIALGMMMVAACPGGNISNFMSHLAKGNVALSISLTAFATFFAIIMTPFNFQFYSQLYAPTAELVRVIQLDIVTLARIVLLILGVPLLLGMLIRYVSPQRASQMSRLLKPLSIIVFLGFVVVACFNNIAAFEKYLSAVFAYGLVHNLMALLLGFSLAKLFKLSLNNTKTITIETGIQNSGLGLVLIFTFFDGLGGMALIAAFWGISHIIFGLGIASYWSGKNNNSESKRSTSYA